jgi:transcriptional regulator with XRE-family HTH domain
MTETAERTYGDFVREVREAGGFTQKDIADRMGVARSTWIRWETGSHLPLPMFRRVIEKLGNDFRVPRPPRIVSTKEPTNGHMAG